MIIDKLRDYAFEVLSFSWPIVLICLVVVISLRVAYLINKRERPVFYREVIKLIFLIYILCLFQVVTYRDISFQGINYTPFKEIFRYDIGSSLFYRNVLGNMILFLPFGLIVGYFVDTKKFRYVIVLSLIASLSIEFIQLAIGRVFDIDDVLLNITGSVVGFALYRLIYKIGDSIPVFFKKESVLNILSIILLGGLIWFLIPWKMLMFITTQIII